jgi:hypothetical protein
MVCFSEPDGALVLMLVVLMATERAVKLLRRAWAVVPVSQERKALVEDMA